MKKQIKRKIYLLSKREQKPIEVVQYETGIQLVFEVQDIELDTSATATLFVRKPSGKFVFQEDDISIMGNTVVIDLHNQALTEYGKPFFQIKFKKEEEVISTYSGMLTVDKSLDDSGAEESKTVIAAFVKFTDEQISRIEEATQTQIDLMKAEVEAKGLSVLSTIPDEYTEMYNRVNTLFNSVANAIKGTVSGPVVRVDDVSPVEHSVKGLVRGKNLFDISKVSVMSPSLSAYVSEVGEDYIVVTTPEGYASNGYCTISRPLKEFCPALKIGKTYILNGITQSNSNNVYLPKVGKSWVFGQKMVMTEDILNSSVTFYGLSAQHGQGVGNCVISNIQIEEGDTVTEYTPYIDLSTVTVRKCGKNLFDISKISSNSNISNNGDTLTVKAAVVQTAISLKEMCEGLKVGQTATLSFDTTALDKGTSLYTKYIYLVGAKQTWVSGDPKVITQEMLDSSLYLYSGKNTDGSVIEATISKIQIEIGNAATDYEAYREPTAHTPSSDGTVEGIVSLSPTMTLLTDTEGITIECEYNKDTGKVIEKLTNAVVNLGGVI